MRLTFVGIRTRAEIENYWALAKSWCDIRVQAIRHAVWSSLQPKINSTWRWGRKATWMLSPCHVHQCKSPTWMDRAIAYSPRGCAIRWASIFTRNQVIFTSRFKNVTDSAMIWCQIFLLGFRKINSMVGHSVSVSFLDSVLEWESSALSLFFAEKHRPTPSACQWVQWAARSCRTHIVARCSLPSSLGGAGHAILSGNPVSQPLSERCLRRISRLLEPSSRHWLQCCLRAVRCRQSPTWLLWRISQRISCRSVRSAYIR